MSGSHLVIPKARSACSLAVDAAAADMQMPLANHLQQSRQSCRGQVRACMSLGLEQSHVKHVKNMSMVGIVRRVSGERPFRCIGLGANGQV